jgi:RNA polymerase II-associated factor 1
MKTEHDSFLAFYLTEDNESALKFKETRFDLSPYEVPENEEVSSVFISVKMHTDQTLGNNIPFHA